MKKTALIIIILIISAVLASGTLAATVKDGEFEKALEHYKAGKYAESLSVLESYVQDRPEAYAYYLMGYALYALGRHDEATRRFQDAYLIDPEFSPEEFQKSVGMYKKFPVIGAPAEEAPAPPAAVEEALPSVAAPEEAPAPPPETAPAPQPVEERPAPAPMRPAPPLKVKPPAGLTGPMIGLIAGFGILAIVVPLALYLYYSLCLFLIARKTGVPGAWMAWVPILQTVPMVRSADKPVWWVLPLLLVPIVNIVLLVIVFMVIAEKLGKSRVLGILMLLPIINLIILGLLAFSKQRAAVSAARFSLPELPEVPKGEAGPAMEYEATPFDDAGEFGQPAEAAPEEPRPDFSGLLEEAGEASPPIEEKAEEGPAELEELDFGEDEVEELTLLEDEDLFKETEGEPPSLEELGFTDEDEEDIPILEIEEEGEQAEEAEEAEEAKKKKDKSEPSEDDDATKEHAAPLEDGPSIGDFFEEGLPAAGEALPLEEPPEEKASPF